VQDDRKINFMKLKDLIIISNAKMDLNSVGIRDLLDMNQILTHVLRMRINALSTC